MLVWFNKFSEEKKVEDKTHAEVYQENEEHLIRERVSLEYDLIRSLAK